MCFLQNWRKGSKAQVGGFIIQIMSSTSRCDTSEKELRSLEISNCVSAGGAGKDRRPERVERIFSIFILKMSMKLLQCSSIIPVRGEVWGLRRSVYDGEKLLGISRTFLDDV